MTMAMNSKFAELFLQRKKAILTSAKSLHERHACRTSHEQFYLLGVRGLFVLSSFLWVFMETFVPAAVKDSDNTTGKNYQIILRKTLSNVFWNDSLLYSLFIFLSGRSICLSFFKNYSRITVARSVFRRGVRLVIPVAVSLAIITTISHTIGYEYISSFKESISNTSISEPYILPNALTYFNAVFNLFWVTNNFQNQAANLAFPSQTLWLIAIIFSQSYTIYMTMVIVPYTRNKWRIQAFVCFILSAWWVQSWAWYSITGLLLADAVSNMEFKLLSQRGIPIPGLSLHIPSWIPYMMILSGGLVMQFVWATARPGSRDSELEIHAGLYYTGGLNKEYNVSQPQARDDNYLVIAGFFLLLETYDWMQRIFSTRVLIYLGRRALSFFLTQSIIVYVLGIKLFAILSDRGVSFEGVVGICLVVCFMSVVLVGEVFYWLVDTPSQFVADMVFDWICL